MKKATLLLFLLSSFAFAGYDPADDLMTFFGNRCDTNGAINAQANNDSNALRGVLEAIQDDLDCDGVSGILQNLSSTSHDALLLSASSENNSVLLQNQIQSYELALAAEQAKNTDADPSTVTEVDYVNTLKSNLIDAKVNLILSHGATDYELMNRKLDALRSVQGYSNELFSRLDTYQRCLNKHPNLIAQVGVQMLGMSSNLVSGVFGSVMLSAGTFADGFIRYLNSNKTSKILKKMSKQSTAEAVGCGFEALAKTYCEARDMQTILDNDLKIENKLPVSSTGNSKAWEGIEVLAKDFPALTKWLGQLVAGSTASSVAQAEEKKFAEQMETDVRKLRIDTGSLVAEKEKRISSGIPITDAQMRILLNDLYQKVQSEVSLGEYIGLPTTADPFALRTLFSDDLTCGVQTYLYTASNFHNGGSKICKRDPNIDTDCLSCIARVYFTLPKGTVPPLPSSIFDVKAAVNDLMDDADSAVALDVALIKQNDPQKVVTNIDSMTVNNRSARDSLFSIEKYLLTLQLDPTLPTSILQFVGDSLTIVQDSIKIINNPSKTADTKLSELSLILTPGADSLYLIKRIDEIVKQVLDKEFAKGTLDENLKMIFQIAPADTISSMISQFIGKEAARMQVDKAKVKTRSTIENMNDYFGSYLLEQIKTFSADVKEVSDKSKENMIDLSCIQSVLASNAPMLGKKSVSPFCNGRAYKSSNGVRMEYNVLVAKPFEDRVCVLYDFFRKSKIKEMTKK